MKRFAFIAMAIASTAVAQTPSNLSFENADASGRAIGWGGRGPGYEIVVDSTQAFGGRRSLRSRWIGPGAFTPGQSVFSVASQSYPIPAVAGRKLRLVGYIKTQDVQQGYAGFWMRVDGPMGQTSIAFDNMASRGVRGTTPWAPYTIELPVDSGAALVIFGIIHPGDGTAWFDSLTVEVVGPPMPRTIAAFRPAARPPEDMTRLLTDTELAVPSDSFPTTENPAYADWVRANARPIRSIGSSDFSDLRFFEPLLRGKRIVQLGESGHGVAEFNLAKVRLIKFLHEELGYDVMAFESSTFECDRAQRNIATLSALDLMRACIFGVWHAQEVLPLFEYIKQTQSTSRPLVLAGFDNQTSSGTASARPAFLRDVVRLIDTAYARRVYETDSTFLATTRNPSAREQLKTDRAKWMVFYDSLATFLRANKRAIEAARRDDPHAALIARQAAVSMKAFADQLAAGFTPAGTEARDRAMADNLDFLLDEVYPGKKVIVWAHNFHIQHRINALQSADTANRPPRTMGVWVAERRRPELYTIGLFMYRGAAAQNDRRPYPISRMPSGSLESILHRAPWRYTFVDFSRTPRVAGSEWMWSRLRAMEWGTNPQWIVPRDEYDGVLFIDTTHPPNYIR
jgi:erythromycin esterase